MAKLNIHVITNTFHRYLFRLSLSCFVGDDASGFSSWASDDEECDLCLTSCLYDGDLETPKPRGM